MTSPFDGYLDIDEAARRLHVHAETVKRWIRDGRIPATKAFGKWLVAQEVVDSVRFGTQDMFDQREATR